MVPATARQLSLPDSRSQEVLSSRSTNNQQLRGTKYYTKFFE
jgi:hypothetical protein